MPVASLCALILDTKCPTTHRYQQVIWLRPLLCTRTLKVFPVLATSPHRVSISRAAIWVQVLMNETSVEEWRLRSKELAESCWDNFPRHRLSEETWNQCHVSLSSCCLEFTYHYQCQFSPLCLRTAFGVKIVQRQLYLCATTETESQMVIFKNSRCSIIHNARTHVNWKKTAQN